MRGRIFTPKRPPTTELARKIRLVHKVSQKLTSASVTFGVWSGMHATLLAGHRISDDIDIWVSDEDIHRVAKLFPLAKARHTFDRSIISFQHQGIDVEIMARMDIHTADGIFPMRLTHTAAQQIRTQTVHGSICRLANAADTILLKAILQRAPEQGKNDLRDIQAIATTVKLDTFYLKQRIEETASKQRVMPLLKALRII